MGEAAGGRQAGGRAVRVPGRVRRAPCWTTTRRSCSKGIPSIDLIDFDFPCWHQTCDDLTAVSKESLNLSGEAVLEYMLTEWKSKA